MITATLLFDMSYRVLSCTTVFARSRDRPRLSPRQSAEARQSRYRLQSRYRAANSGNKLFRSNGGGYTATGHVVLF